MNNLSEKKMLKVSYKGDKRSEWGDLVFVEAKYFIEHRVSQKVNPVEWLATNVLFVNSRSLYNWLQLPITDWNFGNVHSLRRFLMSPRIDEYVERESKP